MSELIYRLRDSEGSVVNEVNVGGQLSVVGAVDRSVSPPKFTVSGYIETTERLPDFMEEVKAGRITLFDVLIDSESFGSESDEIVYQFSAKNYRVSSRSEDPVVTVGNVGGVKEQ